MATEVLLYSENYKPRLVIQYPGVVREYPDPNGKKVEVTCLPDNSGTVVVSRTFQVREHRANGLRGLLRRKDRELVEIGTSKHTLREGMQFEATGGGWGFIESLTVTHREKVNVPKVREYRTFVLV